MIRNVVAVERRRRSTVVTLDRSSSRALATDVGVTIDRRMTT
jgi:hypothetical protein